MSEHRYDIRISESCVYPIPEKVERQDPDNLTRFQTRERCAWEIAAYVFKDNSVISSIPNYFNNSKTIIICYKYNRLFRSSLFTLIKLLLI